MLLEIMSCKCCKNVITESYVIRGAMLEVAMRVYASSCLGSNVLR